MWKISEDGCVQATIDTGDFFGIVTARVSLDGTPWAACVIQDWRDWSGRDFRFRAPSVGVGMFRVSAVIARLSK